jgi:hypothetical protein
VPGANASANSGIAAAAAARRSMPVSLPAEPPCSVTSWLHPPNRCWTAVCNQPVGSIRATGKIPGCFATVVHIIKSIITITHVPSGVMVHSRSQRVHGSTATNNSGVRQDTTGQCRSCATGRLSALSPAIATRRQGVGSMLAARWERQHCTDTFPQAWHLHLLMQQGLRAAVCRRATAQSWHQLRISPLLHV